MTDEEYAETQMLLTAYAQIIGRLPLSDFLARIATADAAGPVIDPTLYRQGHKRLAAIKELAVAGLRMQAAFTQLQQTST